MQIPTEHICAGLHHASLMHIVVGAVGRVGGGVGAGVGGLLVHSLELGSQYDELSHSLSTSQVAPSALPLHLLSSPHT